MLSSFFRLAHLAIILLSVGGFCFFYWCMSYQELAVWYKQINPFFYNSKFWETELFTPAVKLAGNWWCGVGLSFAGVVGWLGWKMKLPKLTWKIPSRNSIAEYVSICAIGTTISLAVNWSTIYTSDEVFSATNFASLPFFQTISNYPKPNNHLLFNALNKLLFFGSDDLVFTGRLISLAFYNLTLCATWIYLKKWKLANLLKCLILSAMAVQFPVLGFSWQARGYEMVLFFSMVSFISLMDYLENGNNSKLILHSICNIAGIFTLPSYLYWWAGLGLAAMLYQIYQRELKLNYLKTTAIAIAASLISYLPLLCFSGIASLTENKYVAGEKVTRWHFLTHLNERHYFEGLFSEWFCAPNTVLFIGIAAILLPILFLAFKQKKAKNKAVGIVSISMVLAFLAMSIFLLRLPYYRNLLAHGYLFLLIVLLCLAIFISSKTGQYILGASLLFFVAFSVKTNLARLPNDLYYYHVQHEYEKAQNTQVDIDTQKPIYLDYEDFYWWYLLRQQYDGQHLLILPNRTREDFENISSNQGPFQSK